MSGSPIPSHSPRAPRYECETCRDSGSVYVVIDEPYEYGTGFIPCPSCDGKPRLAGEVDDTVPTPFLHLLKNLRHGGPS